jgi:hypothetical protein
MCDTRGLCKRLGGTALLMAFAMISPASLLAQSTSATPEPNNSTRSQISDGNKQKPTSPSAPESTSAKPTSVDIRKAQILEDTNRLYRMAEELKAEVDKSNKDILSVAVVKKADEIEKLAKSLKERMRND